jgi:hypothetical protein
VSPAIVSDAAVSPGCEKEHLVLKRIRAERPAVAEDYGLAGAPVVEVNLGSVFGRDFIHDIGLVMD